MALLAGLGLAWAAEPRVETVEAYFTGLPHRFVAGAATGVDAVVVWEVAGTGTWHAVIRHDLLVVGRGAAVTPDLVVRIAPEALLGLANGDTDGTTLYLTRQLQVDGSMDLAWRLSEMLPPGR